MPSRLSFRHARVSGRAFVPALAVAAVIAATSLAALPAAVAQEPSIPDVERQLAVLEAEENAATERVDAASATVADAEARLRDLQLTVDTTKAKLSSARDSAGRLAAASYRTGGPDVALLGMFVAENPEAMLRQSASLSVLTERQNELITRVAAVRTELAVAQGHLTQQVTDLAKIRQELSTQQTAVADKRTAAANLLGTLQAAERERLEAERQRRQEAERASRSTGSPAAASSAPAAASPAPASSEPAPTKSAPTDSAPASEKPAPADTGGSCPPSGSRGAEERLTPATLQIMRCGLAAFPQIESAGGWGTRGNATDHDDGRAVDFMIPNYQTAAGNDLGWAVAEWAIKQPNVYYVIFDQRIWGSYAPESGWKQMANRGSDTANHRNHVHVSVSE